MRQACCSFERDAMLCCPAQTQQAAGREAHGTQNWTPVAVRPGTSSWTSNKQSGIIHTLAGPGLHTLRAVSCCTTCPCCHCLPCKIVGLLRHLLSSCLLLCTQQEPVPTSLLRLAPEHAARAVKMFAGILRYCGDAPGSEQISQSQAIETAQKLLHQVRQWHSAGSSGCVSMAMPIRAAEHA